MTLPSLCAHGVLPEGCRDCWQRLTPVIEVELAQVAVPRSAAPTPAEQQNADPGNPPLFVDVAALLAGGLPVPPAPTVCRREDAVGLFYRGQVNSLFGDPECGKTWVALAATAEVLADGGRALVIDADHNGAPQILARLQALGVSPGVLGDPGRFRLAEPEDGTHLRLIVTEAEVWQPTLAVVDSVGEVLPLLGMNSNSPDDFTAANRAVMRPLARSGAAVVTIDHLAKSPESRAAGPTGTAAKRRAAGGTSLRVTLREPFAPGRGGSASLSIAKDRAGGLRGLSPVVGRSEQPGGIFILTERNGELSWRVTVPTADDAISASEVSGRKPYTVTPDDVAEIDSLDEHDRESVRNLRSVTGWGSDRATAALREWRSMRTAP